MKVLGVTGGRADWGLLSPVFTSLVADPRFNFELCVTGQHLDPESPSLAAIEAEGIAIDHRVDMGLGADDSPETLAHAMGTCTARMGSVLAAARPDILLVLGDRYEILSVASAALLFRIPVVHLCGGDVTEGAFDDAIRHALTKLSALHFVTNEAAAARVRQLGEDPGRIVVSGSPGIDRILVQPTMERDAFLSEIGLPGADRFALVSFHPETLADDPAAQRVALIEALDRFRDLPLLLSGSNADPGGREIDAALRDLARTRANAVFFSSLGSRRYFSAMRHAVVMIGNSSSGLYEAPSFGLTAVNIGDRQKGRPRAASVVDCPAASPAIEEAIRKALKMRPLGVRNPFGDGNAAEIIVEALAGLARPRRLVNKTFKDLT